jgi:LPS-assembly protein
MIWIVRAILLLCLLPAFAKAQSSVTDGVLINADTMDRDLTKKMVRLEGNVQVVFQGQHLSCRKAEVDLAKQQIRAEGDVILFNEKVHAEGDRIVFNYKQNTGYIYNGFVQSGQVIFEGDIIQKVSEQRYIANNASFTACDTCPAGWSFSGKTIDAELGGYARIRRPIFRLGGFPVMIAPGLIVPLKSSRQSGLLVPTMEQSKEGGFAFAESYFWAINRSQDFTFTPKWYSERGLKLLGDYRYVLNETSQGRLRGAWVDDQVFRKKVNLPKYDRWFIWYQHQQEMPGNFTHRADIRQVSDLRYPREFPSEITGHGDPALENKTSITKSTDNQIASAEVDIYTNLLHSDPLSNNDDAVHRAPEIRHSIKEINLFDSGMFFKMDTQYVNFTRNSSNYDDLKTTSLGGGRFHRVTHEDHTLLPHVGRFSPFSGGDPQDLMRTGQRFDVNPKISYPFQIGRAFDVVPAVSYRETQYRFYPSDSADAAGFGSSAARRYLQTDLAVKTEFTRVYGGTDPKASRMKHSLEPELSYSHIPWLRKPGHPFFGDFEGLQYSRQFEPVSDADLDNRRTGLQFDYMDRTYEKQLVNFALMNRFTRKTWVNGEPDYQTVGVFRLAQAYDLNEAKSSTTPRPWSSVNMLADLRFDHFETYTTAEYNGYAKVTNVSSRARLKWTEKNFLQAGYTRNFIFDDNYVPTNETRNFTWGAGLALRYLDAIGQFEYEARNTKLQAFSYVMNVRPPGKCWVLKFEQRLVVNGEQTVSASFNFDFGGENKDGLL